MGVGQGLRREKENRPWVEMLGALLFSSQDKVLVLPLELLNRRLEDLPTALWPQVEGHRLPPPELFV